MVSILESNPSIAMKRDVISNQKIATHALSLRPVCRKNRLAVMSVVLLLLSACSTLYGPNTMTASRLQYNQAVQISDQRELLLNLVRLRYTEAPEFFAISAISTQMRYQADAEIGTQIGEEGGNGVALVSPGASVQYSESPTITFVPQRDQEFSRQLVTPVELENIYLLTHYGWALDRVLRLLVTDMNGIRNYRSREYTNQPQVALKEFRDVAVRLRQLQLKGLLTVDVQRRVESMSSPLIRDAVSTMDVLQAVSKGFQLEQDSNSGDLFLTRKRNHYVIRVEDNAWQQADSSSLLESIGIAEGKKIIDLDSSDEVLGDQLDIQTRSVLGAMAYLSNAVAVPPEHEKLAGAAFTEDQILQELLSVRVSIDPPENAFIGVQHRGYWFYVDDFDLESKQTLGLLTSLIRLNIDAGGAQSVPVLTLPVAN